MQPRCVLEKLAWTLAIARPNSVACPNPLWVFKTKYCIVRGQNTYIPYSLGTKRGSIRTPKAQKETRTNLLELIGQSDCLLKHLSSYDLLIAFGKSASYPEQTKGPVLSHGCVQQYKGLHFPMWECCWKVACFGLPRETKGKPTSLGVVLQTCSHGEQ